MAVGAYIPDGNVKKLMVAKPVITKLTSFVLATACKNVDAHCTTTPMSSTRRGATDRARRGNNAN